jgi:hypothetical protein
MAHHALLARLGLQIAALFEKPATSADLAWVNGMAVP